MWKGVGFLFVLIVVAKKIEAFSFHCPECDFKSTDRHHFKRHTMESHNKSKVFFIMSKSGNAFNKDPFELKTGSDYHGEN